MSEGKKIALRAVLADKPIAYHPILARITGTVEAGILLGQLLYWDGVMSRSRGRKWDGWFYKSAAEVIEETALSRSNFETAREKLKTLGLIKTELHGVPATMHYQIDIDAIEAAIESHANKIAETLQTRLPKPRQLFIRIHMRVPRRVPYLERPTRKRILPRSSERLKARWGT